MKYLLVLLVCVAATSALSIREPSINVTGRAMDLNEAIFHALDVILREEMRNGNPYTGFPVLAPLSMATVPTEVDLGGLIFFTGFMRNLHVDGIDGYIVHQARLNFANLRFEFDFTWPRMVARGFGDMTGVFGGLIPIFQRGDFHVEFHNFRFRGFAALEFFGPENNIHFGDLVMSFTMQRLVSNIQGMIGGGEPSDLINIVLEDLVPSLLNNFNQELSESIRDFILPRINPFLNNLTLEDLVNQIPQSA